MNASTIAPFELCPHPGSVAACVRALRVRIAPEPGGWVRLLYKLEGDIAQLRLPAAGQAGRAERLWQHTCCELFIARDGADAYEEYNFSPSGQWAHYRFRRYRERGPGPESRIAEPEIALQIAAGWMQLEASILLDEALTAAARIALAVVVEDVDGALGYWALAHPPGKPDFHHPLAFLPLPT